MNAVIERLMNAYRDQLRYYDEVLELSLQSSALARAQRPLEELNALAERKRAGLRQIEQIENEIAADKNWWRETGRDELGNPALDQLLRELAGRIEQILRGERETEHWILNAVGLDEGDLTGERRNHA